MVFSFGGRGIFGGGGGGTGGSASASPDSPAIEPLFSDGDLGGLQARASSEERGVLDEVPSEIDWLYPYRGSDLFPNLWRRLGRKVLEESIPGATEYLDRTDPTRPGHDAAVAARAAAVAASAVADGAGAAAAAGGAEGEGGDGDNEGPDPNDPMLQVPQELRQPGNEDALGQYMQEHAAEFEAYQQARQRRQERREALQAEAFAQQDRDKRVRELLETSMLQQSDVIRPPFTNGPADQGACCPRRRPRGASSGALWRRGAFP